MRMMASLLCGLVFGAGLLISGMVQPTKVLGFLDIFGAWDPSLAVVMAAALAVSVPGFMLANGRARPLLATKSFGPPGAMSTGHLSLGRRYLEQVGGLLACARGRRWKVSRRCRPVSSSSSPPWPAAWRCMIPGKTRNRRSVTKGRWPRPTDDRPR